MRTSFRILRRITSYNVCYTKLLRFVAPDGYCPESGELRFDMFEGEYTHEGEDCTFEVLVRRFALGDPALTPIAEVVHDLDCKDEKFGRDETVGVSYNFV